jgi:hypothetical protein
LFLIRRVDEVGQALFYPNSRLRMANVTDGTSHTLAFAEVKAWTPYLRDGGSPAAVGAAAPDRPASVVGLGGDFKVNSGHTEWVDGRIHQTGFTSTFAPGTKVAYAASGQVYDIDFNSSREGKSISDATYAAVTARSYHTGGVQVAMTDGAVRFVAETIQLGVWRSLASRAGGEVASLD